MWVPLGCLILELETNRAQQNNDGGWNVQLERPVASCTRRHYTVLDTVDPETLAFEVGAET